VRKIEWIFYDQVASTNPIYTMADDYETVYHVGLFDDLHNFLPAVLYEPSRFRSVQDLLSYIQTQSQFHFNIYNRGQQRYNRTRQTQPQPTNGRRAVNVTTHETIDITPLFTTQLPTIRRTAGGGGAAGTATVTTIPIQTDMDGGITMDIGATPVLDELMNILQQGLLRPRGTQPVNLDPVVVRPTAQQIEHATTIRAATQEDEENNCSICQDCFLVDQTIRQITHCEHDFHRECIDPWFTRNVHCPVCRFDIRESE
jgi:hypothetical protein